MTVGNQILGSVLHGIGSQNLLLLECTHMLYGAVAVEHILKIREAGLRCCYAIILTALGIMKMILWQLISRPILKLPPWDYICCQMLLSGVE
ncbi:hypothetical protein Nepgr_008051 [Nepenthes gracilis]|uniref:Uncharacterized protein n=1 Tax=Nepenthes gracilis TaxID=150966 RepID=A0AAD3XJ32_NEPGR|nr:hypothetical protein Nepgr_008051 [Nepenthes gracilis]